MSGLLAAGYAMRPATKDDGPGIHALMAAFDTAEWGDASTSLGQVEDILNEVDPSQDTWLVTGPTGDIVGFAYITQRRHIRMDVEGYVHPDHTGQGIGTSLVRVSEARAREHVFLAPEGTRVVVQNWINANSDDACALLEGEGYTPFRYFLRMEATLDGNLPAPEWPQGVIVRTCEAESDRRLMYVAMEDAMADHWGFVPRTWDEWIEPKSGSSYDPSLWFLAMRDDEPIGGAICSVVEGIGWVDSLGVRAGGRKQGLGMALLRHAAREFVSRGVTRMALGVDSDSPTGATRLYERAGMHVAQRHATYGKDLRPGVALNEA